MTSALPSPPPVLTVAIAAGARQSYGHLEDALAKAGLLINPGVEVCIAHAGGGLENRDPRIRTIPCPAATPIFRLYEIALEQTNSRYVALLDAGCPPASGWLEAALGAIRAAKDIFYGPVDPGWPSDDPRIIGYLVEYIQFQQPLARTLSEYPGNNIVFRRQLLARTLSNGSGFQKTFFLRRVERELCIKPDPCDGMAVVYQKSYSWAYYLRRRLRHGRLYGSSHARSLGARRYLYAGGSLILPLLRCWRILHAAGRSTTLRATVLRFSPRILASECAWSMGECQGYLIGAAPDDAYLD